MGSKPKISRSPSPQEADDGEDEWPVYGVVGEDVDVFGISRYVLDKYFTKWQTLNNLLNHSYEASARFMILSMFID